MERHTVARTPHQRHPALAPQTYVQDLVRRESGAVYRKLVLEGGHFFVCGDCTMAEHVYQTLKVIIQERGAMTDSQVERYMLKLRVSFAACLSRWRMVA